MPARGYYNTSRMNYIFKLISLALRIGFILLIRLRNFALKVPRHYGLAGQGTLLELIIEAEPT